jgi:molybdopterin/thiamine biosynthesis adenylyltransferase
MLYEEKFCRNKPTLSISAQEKIRKSVFAIIGLGGVGGFVLENLARLGAENFILFDYDRFELTNYNRQILATDNSLDQKKVDVASARAKSINNKIIIKKFMEFNSDKINNADIVIDATDNLKSKLGISIACRKKKIPYVFSSAEGSKGMVSVFSNYRFEKAFAVDESKMIHKFCTSILSPAASLAGSLAATEALNQIIKKPVIRAPEALFFDIFDKRIFWMGKLG